MTTSLPYISSPGNITKALSGIKSAAVPERVNQDFVKTMLKIPGGSGDQMTSFLKKVGFAHPDGTPTEIYKQYRNPTTSGAAVADAIRVGYAPLFRRNEYAHELSESALVGLIVEETGQAADSAPVKLMASAFKAMKQAAAFDQSDNRKIIAASDPQGSNLAASDNGRRDNRSSGIGLNLGYTININLPATTDQSVYNAIFKSIKANLLTNEDG